MRQVLLVARDFAPTSHVSVERATKLAKYLPDFGWRPTVLTGARPSAGLPSDPGLVREVAGVPVIRAPAPELSLFYRSRSGSGGGGVARRSAPRRGPLHPKAWLLPDTQLLWYPFAVRAALRHPARWSWDAVVGTCFPPTSLLVARAIAARCSIPYVTDFRDGWTGYHHAPRRPAVLAGYERRLERRVVAEAAAVVAVDPGLLDHVLAALPRDLRPPLHVIQNGYDEEDFLSARPADLPAFSIVHAGQMRRPPIPLWEALARLLRERPDLRGRLHLWQLGFVDAGAVAALGDPPEGVVVHCVPPVPQREAVAYLLGADLLLVEEYGSVMPSKTLQYLRAGRPILGFLETGGTMREVLREFPQAHLAWRSEAGQAAALIGCLADRERGAPTAPSAEVRRYSRREIARRFAEVLDAACGRRAVGPRGALGDRSLRPVAGEG